MENERNNRFYPLEAQTEDVIAQHCLPAMPEGHEGDNEEEVCFVLGYN
ncbi:hypothetical protein [Shewanella algidipiscicola]|nr:hypothetical protein [Shewanella algidipiscicola]